MANIPLPTGNACVANFSRTPIPGIKVCEILTDKSNDETKTRQNLTESWVLLPSNISLTKRTGKEVEDNCLINSLSCYLILYCVKAL